MIQSVPRDVVHGVLVVDDGSNDGTSHAAERAGALVLRHPSNRGVGAAIRSGIEFAVREGYDIVVVVSGSGKIPCEQIPMLLDPLLRGRADVVQGSRFLEGGQFIHPPVHRRFGTSLYTLLFSILANTRVSDASCGFRAFRTCVVQDRGLQLSQPWLDRYELEPYFLFKILKSNNGLVQVPVTVAYPPRNDGSGFTKMRIGVDWWRMFRPVLFLATGLKK